MTGYELSEHASEVLKERNIKEEWVKLTMENPDNTEAKEDGSIHYIKAVKEYDGRYLRVVFNPDTKKVITLFFDRRLGRQK